MDIAGPRRKKKPEAFEVVIVPVGDSGTTRRFTLARWKLGFFSAVAVALCVVLSLAALTLTPLMRFLPIPDSLLEARYGKQVFETQRQLKSLAEDVLALQDYNQQLRKALGERVKEDSVARGGESSRHVPPERSRESESSVSSSRTSGDDALVFEQMDPVTMSNAATSPSALRFASYKNVDLPFILPVRGFVTQDFDPAQGHFGMDVAGKKGTPVNAAGDGVVIFSGWTYEYGNTVIMSHGSGYISVYKHNDVLLKGAPATVRRGEPIALLGASGRTSSGPHLHFEVWKDGVPQNPQQLLLTDTVQQ